MQYCLVHTYSDKKTKVYFGGETDEKTAGYKIVDDITQAQFYADVRLAKQKANKLNAKNRRMQYKVVAYGVTDVICDSEIGDKEGSEQLCTVVGDVRSMQDKKQGQVYEISTKQQVAVRYVKDRKVYKITLTKEQQENLQHIATQSVYMRKKQKPYYTVAADGVISKIDTDCKRDRRNLKNGNYFNNEQMAQWLFDYNNVQNCLYRFAKVHNDQKMPYGHGFILVYNHKTDTVQIERNTDAIYGVVYFDTQNIAENAVLLYGERIKSVCKSKPHIDVQIGEVFADGE